MKPIFEQKILHVVVERNKTRETVHARLSFLSAWRHALEVALATCPDDAFSKSARQQVHSDLPPDRDEEVMNWCDIENLLLALV